MPSSPEKKAERISRDTIAKYKKCLETAEKKKARDEISLCPRGYCSAKMTFDVYPSAYANGFASQVCGGKKKGVLGQKATASSRKESRKSDGNSDLDRWFKEDWVNLCAPKDENGKFPPCGFSKTHTYPYCRPSKRVDEKTPRLAGDLSSKQKKEMCAKKNEEGLPDEEGRPRRVRLEKKRD